eukprot:TRINITY_DN34685_c0_g1_i1.p1 TRINITY_DN34685_c0_g1~~TRINITY_DN34685_c0_g1_i1.p1  ORF type:complete len:455 (+),score=69.67 TRINITY_DN34685_c0_g1_i1:47-1366(+)
MSFLGMCNKVNHNTPPPEEDLTPEAALKMKEQTALCDFIAAFVGKHKALLGERNPGDTYKRLRKLGQGACGVVYRVEHLQSGQRHALKEVTKPGTERNLANCVEWKALLTEIEVLSEISHEGCVKLHDLFNTKNHIYMVIELVRGTSLQQYAATNAVTERDASEIGAHVLNALKYLHTEKQIVHRDIKPENILIAAKQGPIEPPKAVHDRTECKATGILNESHTLPLGTNGDRFIVKLVDFGSSRFCAPGLLGGRYGDIPGCNDGPNQPVATPVGTSLFLALETINIALGDDTGSRSINFEQLPKVDIFSLGVVLYILLCRQHPFMGNLTDGLDSMKNKMVDTQTGATKLFFPPDNDLDAPLSAQAKDFLTNTLAHEPEDRLCAKDALLHPWVVCRHYRCMALRDKPITAWDSTEKACYTAPEELDEDPYPSSKRRNIG